MARIILIHMKKGREKVLKSDEMYNFNGRQIMD